MRTHAGALELERHHLREAGHVGLQHVAMARSLLDATAMAESRKHRRWKRAGVCVLALLALALGLRAAVRGVPWVGPMAADALRAIIGRERVSRLEEYSADLEDRFRRFWTPHARPRAMSEVERSPTPSANKATTPEGAAPAHDRPAPSWHAPADVGPMDAHVAAPDDGVWRAVPDPVRPDAAPVLFATLLHPDARRPWTEAFIVTFATGTVRLKAVAGTVEPRALTEEGRTARRPGLIPVEDREHLLAAFNGGFKTEHGQHGMFADGITFVPARNGLCTIVGFADGSLEIASWERVSADVAAARVVFWRQAAPCMLEGGVTNPALADARTRRWGAALAGETVIRRSALGLDSKRSSVYVAVTNDTSAPALAAAMRHAGASDVAQLDVNWSYPKFVLFPKDEHGLRHAQSLFGGFLVGEDDFIQRPYARDFFYLVTRDGETN